jgi:hypothetical protein
MASDGAGKLLGPGTGSGSAAGPVMNAVQGGDGEVMVVVGTVIASVMVMGNDTSLYDGIEKS